MNVEQIITDELREVGAAVRPPPPPDPALLARQSERARSRRVVRNAASVVLAAAVVLGAVVLGSHLGDPKAGPIPAPQPTVLPTGPAPEIDYVKNGVLYLDGHDESDGWSYVISSGAAAIGFRGDPKVVSTSFYLFYNGVKVRAIVSQAPDGAVLSPDGTKAAWVERNPYGTGGSRFDLVSFDLANNRELGRRPVDSRVLGHEGEETEAWEALHSVGNDGTVRYGGVVLLHTWKPGSAVVTEHAEDVPNDEPTGYPDAVNAWVLESPDGAWGAWLTDEKGDLDPQDGTAWVNDGVTVQQPGKPGTRFIFALPRGSNSNNLAWESNRSLLVMVYDDPDGNAWHYVRCTISTRTCQVAPTP